MRCAVVVVAPAWRSVFIVDRSGEGRRALGAREGRLLTLRHDSLAR